MGSWLLSFLLLATAKGLKGLKLPNTVQGAFVPVLIERNYKELGKTHVHVAVRLYQLLSLHRCSEAARAVLSSTCQAGALPTICACCRPYVYPRCA